MAESRSNVCFGFAAVTACTSFNTVLCFGGFCTGPITPSVSVRYFCFCLFNSSTFCTCIGNITVVCTISLNHNGFPLMSATAGESDGVNHCSITAGNFERNCLCYRGINCDSIILTIIGFSN